MSLYHELTRRNVFRVAIAYLALAWILAEVAGTLFPAFGIPDWGFRFVVLLLALGFVPALIFSWAYEITPEGLKREKDVVREEAITSLTARHLDGVTIGLVIAAVAFILADRFLLSPRLGQQLVEPVAIVTEGMQPSNPESTGPHNLHSSIAVLPFVNMSSDPEQEYFSDGISEELLNLLTRIPNLRVISRSSAFSFKGKGIAIPVIAAQLKVAHVLEGSVRKSGNRVRISAQLIDASSDSHLWSETYDREISDIFAVQDEIAAAIRDALKVKLGLVASEEVQLAVVTATNTEAYDAYLRGRELIRLRGRENLEQAIRHLKRSVRLDEAFAPAHAHLAIAIGLMRGTMGAYGNLTLEQVLQKAIPHLDRAQVLEPNLAEAHAGRALLLALNGDLERAVEQAQKALVQNPSYSDAMIWLRFALFSLGRYQEADVIARKLLVTDPLNIVGRPMYARALAASGRVKEGHALADQLLVEKPIFAYSTHSEISLRYEGKIAESLSWNLRKRAEESANTNFFPDGVLGFVWVGEYGEARRISEVLEFVVDLAEGQYERAVQAARTRVLQFPGNSESVAALASVLYTAGRLAEALPVYESLWDFVPEGQPIPGVQWMDISPNEMTMRLAYAHRMTNNKQHAQAAVKIVRQNHLARLASGRNNQHSHRTAAMLSALEQDTDGATAALASALQFGLRDPSFLDDPVFSQLRNEPRFIALQQELDAILVREHAKVLQLICFNNPTSDAWQPLRETCEGVEES
jgi:TolB-like protein/tetratricopeptide (TPR) repeat protein